MENENKESKTVFEVNGIGVLILIGACLISKKIGCRQGVNAGYQNGYIKGYHQCFKDIIKNK